MEKRRRKKEEIPHGPGKLAGFLKFCLTWLLLFAFWGAILLGLLVLYYARDLPSLDDFNSTITSPSIQIQARDGSVISSIGGNRGDYLTHDQVPPVLVEAIIATEDRRFFEHFGIDMVGIVRAMWVNLREGKLRQGGSTISQQLAKISFLTMDRTLKRKIQETLLAFQLERKYSKKEILTLYMNRVYLGSGNYGVDAAAKSYFGKSAREVGAIESAVIAGLLKAPSRFSPFSNPELSAERAQQVLTSMAEEGYLPMVPAMEEIRDVTFATRVYNKNRTLEGGLYFADWVMGQLDYYVAPEHRPSHMVIVTTLDASLQNSAQVMLAEKIEENRAAKRVTQGALLAMSPDGAIRAMSGGVDYQKSQFNRVTQAKRQPGSSFKTFVYLAALEEGWRPDDTLIDRPVTIGDWEPKNYDGEYVGEISLRAALARSVNTVAVQLSETIGRGKVIAMAKRLGVLSELPNHPSIALGSVEVSLLEMTQAYAHLAQGGKWTRAYGITEIKDNRGSVLFRRKPLAPEQALSGKVVHDINVMLRDTMEYGTARMASLPRDTAGKTGTTQNYRDAWFIGYTPQLVTGVWVGNDDNAPMKRVTGGGLPASIWHGFMLEAHRGVLPQPLTSDADHGVGEDLRRARRQENERESFWDRIWESVQ